MASRTKTRHKAEFGDFQTPLVLAKAVCNVLTQRGLKPCSVLEPTCGLGSFLVAALETFATVTRAVGIEINELYVKQARSALGEEAHRGMVEIRHEDFFKVDWEKILDSLSDSLLVIGNPPWVTNSELGALGSSNLPDKSNFQNHTGIDAITGKGNFDISEWMLIKSLEWIRGRHATIAVLCKTAVARKVLFHAWKFGHKLKRCDIYSIDTVEHFGAAVDACLLVIESSAELKSFDCRVHHSLADGSPRSVFGFRKNQLVANIGAYEKWEHLEGKEWYKWRSGIKHDCARVMELREDKGLYTNGMGESVDLENEYLYPMLKSSDIADGQVVTPKRWMLVPQRNVREDTGHIDIRAPRTWKYLLEHADLLDNRSSTIYRKRPRFAVFGVGDYSFAQWKVVISGFYKKLGFIIVGPYRGKPVVFDDTCYFLSCRTEEEARLLAGLLNSDVAKQFFSALIFWDAKRPITASVLRRLDLLVLAKELDLDARVNRYLMKPAEEPVECSQLSLDF